MIPSLKSVLLPRIQSLYIIRDERKHNLHTERYSQPCRAFIERCEGIFSPSLPFYPFFNNHRKYNFNVGDANFNISDCRCGDERRSPTINIPLISQSTFYYLDLVEVSINEDRS